MITPLDGLRAHLAPLVVEVSHNDGADPAVAAEATADADAVLVVVGYTDDAGAAVQLSVTTIIQVTMGVIAAVTLLVCKVKTSDATKQSTFAAGMVGAIALCGIAWLANTFVAANHDLIVDTLGTLVSNSSAFVGALLFVLALFVVAMLTTSQSSATNAIVPIGLAIGLSSPLLVGLWPAAMGIYTLPANGSQVATVAFDQTGTTRMGKFVFDHSFQLPNVIYVTSAIAVGVVLSRFIG